MMTKVLVVDDEKSIRVTLREFLSKEGYDVETAEDAQVAKEALAKGGFDVVVTDIILPRVTGVELLQTIRAAAPHVQVIMMTGEPTVDTATESLRAGAFDYLFKPFTKEAILRTVANAAKVKALDDERRRLEEENRRYQEHLEQLVEEQTADLRASEGKLNAMLASIGDHMSMMDRDLNVLWANETAKRIFGSNIIGKKCYTVYHGRKEPCEPHPCLTLQAFEDGKVHEHDTEVMNQEGEVLSFHCTANVALRDKAGDPLGVIEISRDITEQKRAEAERARLATAIEQAAEAIMVTDPEGSIQYVNPAFERITGYPREEVLGKNPRMLKSGKHGEAFYRNMWITIKGGEVWSGRVTNQKKDGSLYEQEGSIAPVRDSSGAIVNFVAVKRDVTEQTALERRLRQAQKMEAIGALAGGITHDFNNVLAAIIGYGQIAAAELPADSAIREDLARILSAADRAKELVRQILTFSRQGEEERQPVRLHLIVKEALKLLRPSLPSTIEIHEDVDTDCPPVLADPTQMHQVFMNLCTNAYHAMREHGGVLETSLKPFGVDADFARARPEIQEGAYVRLTVSDTGHGMDKVTLERLFEPFFTTKEKGEGTGLGLATAHGIVKAHGGAISVYSEPGKGTAFHVYLPCAETETPEATRIEAPIRGGNERILVVDDEKDLAHLMERVLAQFGYDAVAMTNSADALAVFRAHPRLFDLVITDYTMPKMTGEQLVAEVRRIRPDIPIILTTGFSERISPERAEALGLNAFLMKPADPKRLATLVREVLDKKGNPGA